jgi:beta-carotene hydroxylase
MPTDVNNSTDPQFPPLRELGFDLLHTTPLRRLKTLAAPFVAMACYALFAWLGYWPAAVASVMALSFITYGSTSHDLVHRTLHLPRRWNDYLLSLIELLSLRSGTAYRLSHLHHHQHLLDDEDIEGASAHGSLLRALAGGPATQIRLWRWAWRQHRTMRPWLLAEGIGIVTLLGVAVAMYQWGPGHPGPIVYVALVIAGSWVFPFATVYVPHDARATEPLMRTRLFRGRFVRLIAFDHLYHLEHHLYPAVPHHHWKTLGRRLDPFLARAGVRPCSGTLSLTADN